VVHRGSTVKKMFTTLTMTQFIKTKNKYVAPHL